MAFTNLGTGQLLVSLVSDDIRRDVPWHRNNLGVQQAQ